MNLIKEGAGLRWSAGNTDDEEIRTDGTGTVS